MAIKPYNYLNPQKTTTTASGGIKPFVYNQGNPIADFTQPKKTGLIPNIIGGLKIIGQDIKDVWSQPKVDSGPISAKGYLNQVQGWGGDVINSWTAAGTEFSKLGTQKTFVDRAVGIGQTGLSAINAFFTPITSVFQRAESAPGIVGGTASFVNKLFGTVGVVGADTGESLVQATPFLSQNTKDKITPIVKEIGALAAQIVVGKVGGDVYNKLASKTKIVIDKISEDTRIKHLNETLPKDAITKGTQPIDTTQISETTIKPFDYSKTLQEQLNAPVKSKTAPGTTIVPKVDTLTLEAKKYKSAEEFVKAQPVVYHGTSAKLKQFNNKQGTFFTDDMMNAEGYAGGENVYEGVLNLKKPFIVDAKGRLYNDLRNPLGKDTREIVGKIDQKKYDGVIFKNIKDSWIDDAATQDPSTIYYAFKPKDSFLNESQLTDIWNKAVEKPTAVAPKPIETIPTEGTTPSGLAKSIEAKAIEDNLTKKFDKVAGYDASTIKEQAKIFTDTANKGIDTLRATIRGDIPLPDKAKGFPFIVAMEKFIKDHPELNKNGELSYELANSPHVTSASEAGSQLGLGQNRVQDAFTKKVEEIKKAKAVRAKSSPEKTAKIKTQAQESMKKVNLSKAELGKIEKFINENIC